jgi:hypothetical protein
LSRDFAKFFATFLESAPAFSKRKDFNGFNLFLFAKSKIPF